MGAALWAVPAAVQRAEPVPVAAQQGLHGLCLLGRHKLCAVRRGAWLLFPKLLHGRLLNLRSGSGAVSSGAFGVFRCSRLRTFGLLRGEHLDPRAPMISSGPSSPAM
ncbi:MAG: hypothetical protein ACLSG5_07865 [Oscillospiraceae bacterium]